MVQPERCGISVRHCTYSTCVKASACGSYLASYTCEFSSRFCKIYWIRRKLYLVAMQVAWIVKYMLISIPVVAVYNPLQKGTCKKTTETVECKKIKLIKLKAGQYPMNSTSLKNVYINQADLKDIEYNVFISMNKLKVIDLADNMIEILDSRLFSKLADLNYLNISRNRLKGLSDGRLFQAQGKLIELNLSMNRLVFLKSSVLEPLKSLKRLNFSGNQFDCNCELWKTILWCKNKALRTGGFCKTPQNAAWSTWTSIASQNKCPFTPPPTDPKKIVIIVCVVFVSIFLIVGIALSVVYLRCRNRRKRSSRHKIQVNVNPDFARRPGNTNFNDETTNTLRKKNLSVIPEGVEFSSRAPSGYELDMDTGSVIFEEIDEAELAMFEAANKGVYVNFPPTPDTSDQNVNPQEPSSTPKGSSRSEQIQSSTSNTISSADDKK